MPSTSSLPATRVFHASRSEFVEIGNRLPASMKLTKLYRVQNAEIRQQYEKKKIDMQNACGGYILESQLYHGTTMEAAYEICEKNFDPKKCKFGVFGRGSYFATSPSISHSYAAASTVVDNNMVRYMLISSVLVGRYAQGQYKDTAPPPLGRGTWNLFDVLQRAASRITSVFGFGEQSMHSDVRRYDSCVDNINYPQVFIVYNTDQCCPEYVLEYC